MITAWTKHISDPEEKKQFQNSVLGSKTVLQRLGAILGELEQEFDNVELDKRIYDLPNWDYRQAHMNGAKSILRKIKFIIDLDQDQKAQ